MSAETGTKRPIGFRLRRPCANCPFRTDCMEGWLQRGRAQEIANSITHEQAPFQCHETTEVGGAEPGHEEHCAGALILLEKSNIGPGQYARIAERLGFFDPEKLDLEAPVFDSIRAFIEHHEGEKEEVDCCSVVEPGCEAPAGFAVGGGAVENLDVDPDATSECTTCGEPVCESCSNAEGQCANCGE